MLPEIIFVFTLIAAIFFAFQIMAGNRRRARFGDREILEERDFILYYGPRPEAQTFVEDNEEF